MSAWARAAGLLVAAVADAALGDPRRWHPVAGFGTLADALERRLYRDRRLVGVAYTTLLVAAAASLGAAAEWAGRGRPVLQASVTAAAGWAVLGGASLASHGSALADELAAADVGAGRRRLPALCGRDPSVLDADGLARAGVESVAENTCDAAVAPLLWGALAGVPGLLGYRAVNTLDAMIGYRSARYRRFGWAAARADDVAGYVPARITAALSAALAALVGGSPVRSVRAWRRDAGTHPSPNAGPVEAAAAGALGVRLGGLTVYPHGTELRPELGDGHPPWVADLRRSVRLSRLVGSGGAVLSAALALWLGHWRRA